MIAFVTPTLIDLRAIRSFGVNAKVNENPHGFFGTGLKHSLAGLLRLGQKVTLWRGLDRYLFQTRKVEMRAKGFDFVTLLHPGGHEEEMPFTTELGKTWESWQLFRELHSNTLDERGTTSRLKRVLLGEPYAPSPDQTAFLVEGDEIESAFDARGKTFLSSTPILSTASLEVHAGSSKHAYYRGIRVCDLDRPSLYTYNLTSLLSGLTEDRTLKSPGDLALHVGRLMSDSTDADYLAATMVAPRETYEHGIGEFWGDTPSDQFMEVYRRMRDEGRTIDLTTYANAIYLKRAGTLPIPPAVPLTRVQEKQLAKAITFCRAHGWTVDEYPIVTVAQQRNGLLAWAQDKTIVLTTQVFDKGTKECAAALTEEWLHLRHGFRDETRAFQTHLFQMLITMGEQLTGEPL